MKRMGAFFRVAAALAGVGLASVAQAAVLNTGPSKDNTLYEDGSGSLSDGIGVHIYVGRTSSALRRGLMAFDVSSIPANSVINSVTLSLFQSRNNSFGNQPTISLRKVTSNWGEGTSDAGDPGGFGASSTAGDATWIHTFYSSSLWNTAGGDFSAVTSDSAVATGSGNTILFSGAGLVPDVQAWVNNSSTNFGWELIGDEFNSRSAVRFDTRESSSPPSLTINYTPAPTPEPGSVAILLAGSGLLLTRRRRAAH